MSTEYEKIIKKPIIQAIITKFEDVPSVDSGGTPINVEVIDCDISSSFDQATISCTLFIKNKYDNDGNLIIFRPMDRVLIRQGWNTSSTFKITFFGFIDRVEFINPGEQQRIECRDILKLAQDNFLIEVNRKVYSKEIDESEIDEYGNPMGGQPESERTAKHIISTFLTESGIGTHRQIIDDDLDNIIIGNHATAVFVYESVLDAINRICDLLGYRMWADQMGCVRVSGLINIASDEPSHTYKSQKETYNDDMSWTVVDKGNLINVKSTVDDDLRNWISIVGFGEINVTFMGDSPYIPDPPKYRRAEVRSYLLDTHELILAVGTRIYNELNRLRYTCSITIEGDPRITLGMVVRVYDEFSTKIAQTYGEEEFEGIDYIVHGYSSKFNSGSWIMDVELAGGVGEGSPAGPNISPVAIFTYGRDGTPGGIIRENVAWGDEIIEIFVDASESYSPQGRSLTYVWTCPGYPNGSGVRHVYVIDPDDLSPLEVTLTVTDNGDPPLSSSITHTVYVDPDDGAEYEQRSVFITQGTSVRSSPDGGFVWFNNDLGETTNCVWADAKTGDAIVGTQNGGLWRTEDYGENWTKIHSISDPITAVYIDVNSNLQDSPNSAIAYFGTSTGRVYRTTNSFGSWSLLSQTFLSKIVRIMGNHTTSSRVVVGCEDSIWTSTNFGDSWAQRYSV